MYDIADKSNDWKCFDDMNKNEESSSVFVCNN